MLNLTNNEPKIHLVIPDSHSHPNFDNSRYDLIGNLINDLKPDTVIDIGDWWDFPSLCSYDRGKKSFEGRRYKADVASGVEAQDRIKTIVDRQKRKQPRYIRCLGNHEWRVKKAIDITPEYDGVISLDDLQSKEYRWEQFDYQEIVEVDGVHYSHNFVSGTSGKPIGGENIGRMLLQKKHVSCTQGHSHLFDYSVRTCVDGRKIRGLSCGVFQDYHADYAGQCNPIWDAGLVIKRNVHQGNYDLTWVSMEQLKREYGNN